jgi:Na+/melibiose symporter-like transporter
MAYLAGNVVVAFLLIFIATFPFENQDPKDLAKDDWMIGAAVILVVLALATAIAVFLRRRRLAAGALVLSGGLGLGLLGWALHASEHSDGKVLGWGLAIELAGFLAVASTRSRY